MGNRWPKILWRIDCTSMSMILMLLIYTSITYQAGLSINYSLITHIPGLLNWWQLIIDICRYLTIIGWGWAKYRDLSVASRSIIFRSRRLRQIIDGRDTGKSQYFAITEFNNCFIIRSPSLFFNEYGFIYTWAEIFNCSQTQLDNIAHEQTIICKQLFAGHLVSFWPMKRKKSLRRMIIIHIMLQIYYAKSTWTIFKMK